MFKWLTLIVSLMTVIWPCEGAERIENCRVAQVVALACNPWKLKAGDGEWADLISTRVDGSTVVTSGSAYLRFIPSNEIDSKVLASRADAIRDAFKGLYLLNDDEVEESSGGEGAVDRLGGGDYQKSAFQSQDSDGSLSLNVRVVPLREGMVGVLVAFVRVERK